MRDANRRAITAARVMFPSQAVVDAAQGAILNELASTPFAGLVDLLSRYFNKVVFLTDEPRKRNEEIIADQIAELKTRCVRKGLGAPSAKKIKQIRERYAAEPYQAVRVEWKKEQFIVISVFSLDPVWLEKKVHGCLKNGDLVHMAIAHEVVGMLLNVDTQENSKAKYLIADEVKTHELASFQYLCHVVRHKEYHQVPRFYAHQKKTVVKALSKALNGAGDVVKKNFRNRVEAFVDILAKVNKYNRVRECPLKWGPLVCRKGERWRPTAACAGCKFGPKP